LSEWKFGWTHRKNFTKQMSKITSDYWDFDDEDQESGQMFSVPDTTTNADCPENNTARFV
jgi:hypothetical protein